jgi:hypothetical protein
MPFPNSELTFAFTAASILVSGGKGRLKPSAGEFLRRVKPEFAADDDFAGGVVRCTVSGSVPSASRSGMKRRQALAGSRKGKLPLPTVLRSSPTQSDPSAVGDRQSTSVRDASSPRSMAR